MSVEYDLYIQEHVSNVMQAYYWLCDHFPNIKQLNVDVASHDQSKMSLVEYAAYDAYFYGNNKSHKVLEDFNRAWLTHIHRNPHHWQHWVLLNDDEPEVVIEMPVNYVIEMICDWWSFSFKAGNLMEIFNWYEAHKNMKLHPKTRKMVEDILKSIKEELEKEGYEK